MEATSTREQDPGILTSGEAVRSNRILNAISILLPIAASIYAVVHWHRFAPTAVTLALFGLFFIAQTVGVGIGLHRYFTHAAFETGPVLRTILAVLGSGSFQGPIDRWVADHRRHHRYTDQPLDPHSPHWIAGRRPGSRLLGLLHAHVTWMFWCPLSDPRRYARDILRDPISAWCSRHYWLLSALSVLAPALLGYLAGGRAEAVRGLLWAGFFRVALIHQITWSINSIAHSFGRKPEGAQDESRDITLFAFLIVGEGFHAFHHRHPSAAINQPERLDFGGYLIKAMERAGLAWNLKRVPSP